MRAPKPKKKFSLSNGETSIYYNNAILFPDDFVQRVEASKRERALSETEQFSLIELELLTPSDDEEEVIEALDWEIIYYDEHEIQFKVFFKRPVTISQGSEPTKVKITFHLSELTDEYG